MSHILFRSNHNSPPKDIPKLKTIIKRNSSLFLTSSTDDVKFARNQIDRINSKIFLEKYNQLSPYEKQKAKSNNIYKDFKPNRYIIRDIHSKLSTSNPNINSNNKSKSSLNVLENSEKYYNPSDQMKINDVSSIIKKLLSRNKNLDDKLDLCTYSRISKELCVKGVIVELLKKERMKVEKKENGVSSLLENQMVKLNEDIELFEEFKKNANKNYLEIESLLYKTMQENKKLIEKRKRCNQEYKMILEEIEKTIRNINKIKYYAVFVHKLLSLEDGDEKLIDKIAEDFTSRRNSSNIINIDIKKNRNREEQLVHMTNKIYDKFRFLIEEDYLLGSEKSNEENKKLNIITENESESNNIPNSDNQSSSENYFNLNNNNNEGVSSNGKIDNLLSNPNSVNNLLNSYENDILNGINKNDSIEKVIEASKIINEKKLSVLKIRYNEAKSHYEKLKKEHDAVSKEVNEVKKIVETTNDEYVNFCKKCIFDLSQEIKKYDKNYMPRIGVSKSMGNLFDNQYEDLGMEIVENCHKLIIKMENKTNDFFNTMELHSDDPLFKECINERKKENLDKKRYNERKIRQNKDIILANKLIEKLNNKFVIKRRGVYSVGKSCGEKKNSDKKDNQKEVENEYDIVNYN